MEENKQRDHFEYPWRTGTCPRTTVNDSICEFFRADAQLGKRRHFDLGA